MVIDPSTICFKCGSISYNSLYLLVSGVQDRRWAAVWKLGLVYEEPQMDEHRPHPLLNPSPSPRETTQRNGPKCADSTPYPSGFCKYFAWTSLMVPFGAGVRKDYDDLLSRLFNRHANGFPACEPTELHQDSLFTHCADLSVGFDLRFVSVVQET